MPEGRDSCQKALEFFGASALEGKAVLCCLLLARIELEAGNTELSRQHCQEALRRLSSLELPALNFQANFLMGESHRAVGNRRAAYASYQKAREELETLRSGLRKDELKIGFMKNKSEIYECLVDLCLSDESEASSAIEEAFTYIELAKSRSHQAVALSTFQVFSRFGVRLPFRKTSISGNAQTLA